MTPRPLPARLLLAALLPVLAAGWAACDAGYGGDAEANAPPETALAVRDSSLVDDICGTEPDGDPCTEEDDLLTSTVFVAWSGTDPDGFVERFELRFYNEDAGPGAAGWTSTTARDSLLLLPIDGGSTARVVVEVRAIDDAGAVDPTPARTVFPIVNSPPTLTLLPAEFPPDTTWTVFSFAWEANDPEGLDNLTAVEVSFNDSTAFVALPAESEFATFVVEDAVPGAETAAARVYLGEGFVRTEAVVPGLRLGEANTLYVRAVDETGAPSALARYPDPAGEDPPTWVVRQPTSEVLLVNDFRAAGDEAGLVADFHRETLAGYLGANGFDVWDLSQPGGNDAPSSALPPTPDPTLRETLKLWRYIYWFSNDVTGGARGRNLAFAAGFFDGFFAAGGKLFVQAPLARPLGDAEAPAFALLPVSAFAGEAEGTQPNLRMRRDAPVEPVEPVPGTGRLLPPLEADAFVTEVVPYAVNPTTAVPLYEGTFFDSDNPDEDWAGAAVVASVDTERRVGLYALTLFKLGQPSFTGAGVEDETLGQPRRAIQLILEGLGFPGEPEDG